MNKRRAVVDQVIDQYFDYCSDFTFKLQKGIPEQAIHKDGFINCYWDKKRSLVYMHIDKCGSTSITTTLRYYKDQFIKMDDILVEPNAMVKYLVENETLFFAVVRDPISRWISGLNEFMCRFKPPIQYVIDQVKNNKYVYDEHTAPQHLFLTYPLENNGNFKYLKLDENLSEKINTLLFETIKDKKDCSNYTEIKIPHLRKSKLFIPNYTNICKKIYKSYIEENPKQFNKLYEIDFNLYEMGI